jgi:LysM repeat protein
LVFFSLIYSLPVVVSASYSSDNNSQNVPLLTSTTNFDSSAAVGGADIMDDGEALVSENGPSGTQADMTDTVNTGQISKYTVRKGDSLGSIAKMYGVTTNTIIWANDITSNSVKEGQSLIILPVSGTLHTVVKGDTLKSIANKYKADIGEISQFNGLTSDSILAAGDIVIIPDGEGTTKVSGRARTAVVKGKGTSRYLGDGGPEYPGYYVRPIAGGVKTQGLHGYNAIDIGIPVGTILHAAAAGQVIIARTSGWNGGYGKYVVISHYNGTQTVYGHMSQVNVNEGDTVYQGQVIGLTGNTGNSTGPHLHFEVRGAYNFMNDASEY